MATRTLLSAAGRQFAADVLDDGTVRIANGATLRVTREPDGRLLVEQDGRQTSAWTVLQGDRVWVFVDGTVTVFDRTGGRARPGGGSRHQDQLAAPMPASVRQVLVAEGDTVQPGQTLLLLEAMKMELPIKAGAAGIVRAVRCAPGDLVQPGVPLLEIDES